MIKPIEKIIAEHYKADHSHITFSAFPIPEPKEKALDYAQRFYTTIHARMKCPPRFQKAVPGDIYKEIADWANREKRTKGLYVWGDVGTGKTHSLYALAKLLNANNIGVEVVNMSDWFEKMRGFYDKGGVEFSMQEEMKKPKVMIYDDFGVEKQSEWTNEMIYRLVNSRYELMLTTIFSSNLSPEEIGERYGMRVASRIVEMAGGKAGIIKITGADKRMKQ